MLLKYDPTYSTFLVADHIPIPRCERHLTTLIFLSFKSLRDIGLEGSASDDQGGEVVSDDQGSEVGDQIAEQPSQSNSDGSEDRLGEEVDRALNLAFEEVGFNPPFTSGRIDPSPLEDNIFTDLGDLPGTDPENMAGELLAQFARRRNVERMAAKRRAESIGTQEPPPVAPVEETE